MVNDKNRLAFGMANSVPKNPCHHCVERHNGCHCDCERYKAWKAKLEEARQQKYKAELAENLWWQAIPK